MVKTRFFALVEHVTKKERITQQLKPYLPSGFEGYVADLLLRYPVKFTVSKPRNSKLGDYRPPLPNAKHHEISVNGNSNPYQFLVTTVHEFAHLVNFIQHGNRVKPHGPEWKKAFQELLWPVIDSGLLPKDIEVALMKSISNLKAATCSDTQLSRVLKQYDEQTGAGQLLESLPKNSTFVLQGRRFVKGEKRRTRYLCTELISNKQFVIHALAQVEAIEPYEG